MYKYMIILLLTGCATPQWVMHGTGNGYDYYTEQPITITTTGRVLVREMANFQEPQGGIKSIVGQAEYNCFALKKRVNTETYFSGNMGQGEEITATVIPTDWISVEGMNAEILAASCIHAQNEADKVALQREKLQMLFLGTGVMRNITTMTNNYGTGFATGQP